MKLEILKSWSHRDLLIICLLAVVAAGWFLWPWPLVWVGLEKEPPPCRFFDKNGVEFVLSSGDSVPDGTKISFTRRSVHRPELSECFATAKQ